VKVEEEVRVRKCAEEVTGVTLEAIVGGLLERMSVWVVVVLMLEGQVERRMVY
jgi:hypothetical protein